MAQIQVIHIRAEISFSGRTISTPDIKSFNINRNRGSASTFSASLKVLTTDIQSLTGTVSIHAGSEGNLNKLFTGHVKTVSPSPCWDDPKYFIVNITGVDALYRLEHRRFTRRQIYSDTTWALITRVVAKGKKSGTMKFATQAPLLLTSDKDDFGDKTKKTSDKNEGPKTTTSLGKDKHDTLKITAIMAPAE